MAEYSRMAKGTYTVSGGTLGVSAPNAKIINLPFKPDFVELINLTQAATPANHGIPFAHWDANVSISIGGVQYGTVVQVFNATPVLTTDMARVTTGISAFSAGQLLQYGAAQAVSTVTKANPAVVTASSAHNLTSGDVVIFENLYQTATTGMPQLHNIPFTVTVTSSTEFTIPWNTNQSGYTAYDTATATQDATFKKVLYPYLYFPGTAFISAITLGTTTTVDTTSAHNFVVGQEVAFRIPNSSAHNWGTVELNSLPNTLTPGSPVYGYVVAVTDYNTVVVNIDSSSYTAFNSNPDFADVPGLSYPQIVAVGDVNTGGVAISSGSALYPPPQYMPIGTTTVNTINGPAIRGAYVNNTAQGFVVGAGASRTDTSSWVGGSNGDIMEWRAYLHDMSLSS